MYDYYVFLAKALECRHACGLTIGIWKVEQSCLTFCHHKWSWILWIYKFLNFIKVLLFNVVALCVNKDVFISISMAYVWKSQSNAYVCNSLLHNNRVGNNQPTLNHVSNQYTTCSQTPATKEAITTKIQAHNGYYNAHAQHENTHTWQGYA